MNELENWSSVALICPCIIEKAKLIEKTSELKDNMMKMDDSNVRNIHFTCNYCQNTIDYDVKFRLIELLNAYITKNGSPNGFLKYVTRKGHNIRLRYIKTIYSLKKEVYLIEVADLTTHPKYSLR